jgi:hypothetical protein
MAPEHARFQLDDSEATRGMLSEADQDMDRCSCPTEIVAATTNLDQER